MLNAMHVYTLQPDAPQSLIKLYPIGMSKRLITNTIDPRLCIANEWLIISYHRDMSTIDVPASKIFTSTTQVAHPP
jgi:hypothetical protein